MTFSFSSFFLQFFSKKCKKITFPQRYYNFLFKSGASTIVFDNKELRPRRFFDEFEKACTPGVAARPLRDAHTGTASPLRAYPSGGAGGSASASPASRALLRSFHACASMTADAALMPGSNFEATALEELTALLEELRVLIHVFILRLS